MAIKKVYTFGKRLCTYCGTEKVHYYVIDGHPEGMCLECGRMSYCSRNETVEDVKKRFGEKLKPADYDYLLFEE